MGMQLKKCLYCRPRCLYR